MRVRAALARPHSLKFAKKCSLIPYRPRALRPEACLMQDSVLLSLFHHQRWSDVFETRSPEEPLRWRELVRTKSKKDAHSSHIIDGRERLWTRSCRGDSIIRDWTVEALEVKLEERPGSYLRRFHRRTGLAEEPVLVPARELCHMGRLASPSSAGRSMLHGRSRQCLRHRLSEPSRRHNPRKRCT